MSSYTTDVYHLNVGAGDSTLILVTNESLAAPAVIKGVLIDAGETSSWADVSSFLGKIWNLKKSVGGFTLSAVIVTHYDGDH